MGTAIVAAGAPLTVVPDGQPLPAPVLVDSRVPSSAELEQWERAYKMYYRTQHRARNEALARLGELDGTPLRVDEALALIDGEQQAAFSLVSVGEHEDIAYARGRGFIDRRDGKPATANPYHGEEPFRHHQFMAWYAGWVQADPD